MRTRLSASPSLLAFLVLSACLASAQTPYIVQGSSPSVVPNITANYNLTPITPFYNNNGVIFSNAPAGVPDQDFSNQLAADPNVQSYEQDSSIGSPETDPDAPITIDLSAIQGALADNSDVTYYGSTVRSAYIDQPAFTAIQADQAHNAFPTGGPIVAVIDTGVDPAHPALANVLVGGFDFTRNQPGIPNEWLDLTADTAGALAQSSIVLDSLKTQAKGLNQSTVVILDQSTVVLLDGVTPVPSDFGHGTMVAGLIHLVAPTALIMPLKAFNADGSANMANVVQAIYYATDNGASVINMSFGSETYSPNLAAALQYANAHGVVCIASAGNEGEQEKSYPAAVRNVVGVGSIDANNGRSVFSNYGRGVDMAAPGEALVTTYPGGNYAGAWGTSFSTALVSGAAALLAQFNPTIGYSAAWDLANGNPLDPTLGLGKSSLNVLTALQAYQSNNNNSGNNDE